MDFKMYHVIVMKHIARTQDEDDFDGRQFYYHLKLPFPPYIGLGLSTSGWVCSDIESVHWVQNEHSGQQYFKCRVSGERPHQVEEYFYDFECLCDQALQEQWEPYTKESRNLISRVTAESI
jgi:hypothetical protein